MAARLPKGAPRGQVELLPVVHRSLQQNRLRKPTGADEWQANAERIYAAEWKRQNNPRHYHGWPILSWIISRRADHPAVISQRDADVAASVIQWLATNVGRGFIWTCERKIVDEDARMMDRREVHVAVCEEQALHERIEEYRRQVFDRKRQRQDERRENVTQRLRAAMQKIDDDFEQFRRIKLEE